MVLTDAQRAAVNAGERELLLSAAAGSGKTAVLVERIYHMARDGGIGMDRMLVVTFTHAAAAEMRDRLERRFADADDAFGRRQRELLDTAMIGTIHSFCRRLVKMYFQVVDVDAQATLCDSALRQELLGAALEEALDTAFERAASVDGLALKALTDKFSEAELSDMALTLYEFMLSLPDPFDWLDASISRNASATTLFGGALGEMLTSDARVLLDGALSAHDEARRLVSAPNCPEGYRLTMEQDGLYLSELRAAADHGLRALQDAVSQGAFPRLAVYRGLSEEEAAIRDAFKEARQRYIDIARQMMGNLPGDEDACVADMALMQPALHGLRELVALLHEGFLRRKRERGVMDFHDLEHFALQILRDESLRGEHERRFDAIFVDEYQDVSGIQEELVALLGGGEPGAYRTYVGDVKQSIYRFRQADPTLFLRKLNDYPSGAGGRQRKLLLNQNFRSREAVLDGVNRVFTHVMRPEVTELAYGDEARLTPGTPSFGDAPVELHLFDVQAARAQERVLQEARAVARMIIDAVGQPRYDRDGVAAGTLRYRDIGVLLPVGKRVAALVERTLCEAGIPVYSEDGRSGMGSGEIRLAAAHLRLLDSPLDDMALLCELRGPAWDFTDEELCAIRLCAPGAKLPFWTALHAAAEDEQADATLRARCRAFLDTLENERFRLASQPVDEYLFDWLDRSGVYARMGAEPGGRLRQANLRMLCDQAGEMSRALCPTLRELLAYLDGAAGLRDGQSPTVLSPHEDVVRVMTIHKSKGLEFPVVFLMGLGDSIHKRSQQGLISMHPALGLSLCYRNEATRVKRTTYLQNAIALRRRAEERAERARVLYVGMTRARERLVMLGATALWPLSPAPLVGAAGRYAVREAGSMADWLAQCVRPHDLLLQEGEGEILDSRMWISGLEDDLSTVSTNFPQRELPWRVVFHNEVADASGEGDSADAGAPSARQAPDAPGATSADAGREPLCAPSEAERRMADLLQRPRASGKAAAPALFVAPAREHPPYKLGVTALCRRAQALTPLPDETDEAESAEIKRLPLSLAGVGSLSELPAWPSFLSAPAERTALSRGVATHKLLSLLELDALLGDALAGRSLAPALRKQLQALRACGRMTPDEADSADIAMAWRFLESDLGIRALRARERHREWSFNYYEPELTPSILQGVIDLCFLERGAWILVDYKTDRVSDPRALLSRYALQTAIYRRALLRATGRPVQAALLFSLALGEAVEVDDGGDDALNALRGAP